MAATHLDELLIDHIGKGKKIVDTHFSNLVGPGENFGGELSKVEITIEDETTKQKEVLHAVAKKIPTSEILQKIFNIQQTVKAEILFYQKIVPLVQDFQRENGVEDVIDCFPKFYGGRLNLNGSTIVDSDAVIIMENLITSGYKNLDRHVGYRSSEAKIVLKDLANFQSSFLGLKLKKPDFFNKEIRPLCNNTTTPPEDDPILKAVVIIENILLKEPRTAQWVPQIRKVWAKFAGKNHEYQPREPFATFSHCDLWVNNCMMKYENDRAVKNKLVDFQLYNYQSPVLDVLNFLLTSVQTRVLEQEFDDLLKFYHSEFISNLRRLGCDTEPFSYPLFEEELLIDSGRALTWSLLFVPLVVYGNKDQEASEKVAMDIGDPAVQEQFAKTIMAEAEEKLFFMVETFGKRGWLNIE